MLTVCVRQFKRVLNLESLLSYGPSGGVGLIGYCLCLQVEASAH